MNISERVLQHKQDFDDVFEAGKKSAYDAFWDSYQQEGELTNYICAFGGQWTPETFKPKYQIKPQRAYMLFYNNYGQTLKIPDFVEFCDELAREQGKTIEKNPELFDDNGHYQLIDFSNCTDASYALACLWGNHFGVLDFSKCTKNNPLNYLFYSHNATDKASVYCVHKIDKFKVSVSTLFNVTASAGTFANAIHLTDITIEGEIGNAITFGTCPLNKASITSVVNALSDSVTGKTVTFKKTAVNNAFSDAEWQELIATIPAGWSVALV